MTLQQLIARHEAAAPTPIAKGTAVRLVYLLRRELADLDATDRAHVLTLLEEELLALPATA